MCLVHDLAFGISMRGKLQAFMCVTVLTIFIVDVMRDMISRHKRDNPTYLLHQRSDTDKRTALIRVCEM
jgi:hypothetical protein